MHIGIVHIYCLSLIISTLGPDTPYANMKVGHFSMGIWLIPYTTHAIGISYNALLCRLVSLLRYFEHYELTL